MEDSQTLPGGLLDNGNFTLSPASFSSIGTWSTQRYLPMGLVENTELGVIWFWQIEHNGTWHWELANTQDKAVYAYIAVRTNCMAMRGRTSDPVSPTPPFRLPSLRSGRL